MGFFLDCIKELLETPTNPLDFHFCSKCGHSQPHTLQYTIAKFWGNERVVWLCRGCLDGYSGLISKNGKLVYKRSI